MLSQVLNLPHILVIGEGFKGMIRSLCIVSVGQTRTCGCLQATEAIVDFAQRMRKPFAVVPCCVYAAEFPRRRLPVRRIHPILNHVVYAGL